MLLLSPVVSQSTPSPPILSQRYSTYSIVPSSLVPFHYHSLYVIVIDSKKSSALCFIIFILSNPSVSSSLYPLAFVGCWWDLRRDSLFYYLHIILVLGVFQGLSYFARNEDVRMSKWIWSPTLPTEMFDKLEVCLRGLLMMKGGSNKLQVGLLQCTRNSTTRSK
jgi:hypothetical protein